MLTEERYQKILDIVEENKTVTVTSLVKLINTSESTVRRDLNSLAEMGKLIKVHGGAVAIDKHISTQEPSVAEKGKLFADEKELIAKYAAKTINKDDMVYIDAGTTTEKMIDYISETGATYITNGFDHARKLAHKGLKVYILGGQLKATTEAVIGVECVNSIAKYNFTKSFVGVNGITIENGFTTHELDEASVKKAAVEHSYVTYILADHSKFDKVTSVTFAPIKNACIITDKVPNDKYYDETVIKEVLE